MKFTFKILGKTWVAQVVESQKFQNAMPDDSIGFCDATTRSIYIDADFVNEETVRHELAHAYVKESGWDVIGLDSEQAEEAFCEIVGKYGRTIVKQGDMFVRAWKGLGK